MKNGQAVLLRYNNEGEVDENNVGYEEKRDLKTLIGKLFTELITLIFQVLFIQGSLALL